MKIMLTGATGFVGKHLVPHLLEKGHTLSVTSRNSDRARKDLPDQRIEVHQWRPLQEPFPEAALEGVSAVIHLMGASIGEGRWTAARKAELVQSRVDTTRAIAAALPPSVEHFLSAAAVGIYPSHTETQFDEDYFPREQDVTGSFLMSLSRVWELASREVAETAKSAGKEISRDLRLVQMRIGIVLGNGGMLEKLMPLYKMGLGGPVGKGNQYLPWIHVKDLVHCVSFILENTNLSQAVNCVGPNPVDFNTFSRELAKAVRRPHLFRVPETAIRLAMGEQAEMVLASCRALPGKLIDSGFRFEYSDITSALRAIAEEN